ncbi:MAG: type IX secretion system protein PorQ [Bacteroidota bacterium]
MLPFPSVRLHPVLATLVVLFCTASASAQDSRDTSFDLTRLNASPRSAALAGAATALPDEDPSALFANPALLSSETEGQLSLSYLNHLSGINAGFASYARDVKGIGRLAVGLRYLSYGEFDRTTADGTTEGTFGASEAAVTLGYAHDLTDRLRLGGSAHALFESVDDASGSALMADAGVAYDIPSQLLTLSASVHGIGAVTSSLGTDDARLPVDVRVGIAKRLQYLPLTVSITGYELQRYDNAEGGSALDEALRHVSAGGELQLGKALALRLGYDPGRAEDLRTGGRLDLAGLNAGFGISTRRVTVDYARTGWGEFGGLHQFGVRFGM